MGAQQSNKKLRITKLKESGEARKKLQEKYKMSHGLIGKGAFGKVYKGSFIENSSHKVAIKVFKDSQLFDDDIKTVEAEIKVLCQLDHPNIVKYYETFADESSMYIVTEYIKGRTLSKEINEGKDSYNEADIAKIISQVASALNHCHSKGITHRDVKLDNIMVDDQLNVTLLDFGLSKTFTKKRALKSAAGTPSYMAPECFLKSYDEK